MFAIVVVALQKSELMVPVFTLSAALVIVGTALSFYANSFAWRRGRRPAEVAFDWGAEGAHGRACRRDEADEAAENDANADEAEDPGAED